MSLKVENLMATQHEGDARHTTQTRRRPNPDSFQEIDNNVKAVRKRAEIAAENTLITLVVQRKARTATIAGKKTILKVCV